MLLLGLKRDLRTEGKRREREEVVDPLYGYRIAQDLRCDGYLECSALTGELMREVKEDLSRVAVGVVRGDGGDSSGGGGGCVVG